MTTQAAAVEAFNAVTLQRFCVKFFARPPTKIDDAKFIEIFHEWIRRQNLPGILIDVADYQHVQDGPGILLVSHDANLYMDRAGSELGLLYQRKTEQTGTLAERILGALDVALTACSLLQQEMLLEGKLHFDGGRFCFIANDRLLAPNDEATATVLREDITAAAARLYGGAACDIEKINGDPRERLTIQVKANLGPTDIETLLQNIRRKPH
ncbi:MAG: hypothetical protein ACE5K1_07970 [Acidiferrobacterales bacterium]